MKDADTTHEFLVREYLANRTHADHINDHRLSFLIFFVGFVATAIGATQYLLINAKNDAVNGKIVIPILGGVLIFGTLSLFVILNYWLSRDFIRARNQKIENLLQSSLPNLKEYFEFKKDNVSSPPDFTSIFACVYYLFMITNLAIIYLMFALASLDIRLTLVAISVAAAFQSAIMIAYRHVRFPRRRTYARK